MSGTDFRSVIERWLPMLKGSLNKLHGRGYLISPFSRWEKGRGRGA